MPMAPPGVERMRVCFVLRALIEFELSENSVTETHTKNTHVYPKPCGCHVPSLEPGDETGDNRYC